MSDNKDSETKIALLVISVLIALVVISVLWFGAAQGFRGKNAATATGQTLQVPASDAAGTLSPETTVVLAQTPAAGEASATDANSSVIIEDGVVKFSFPAGSAQLPAGAGDALSALTQGLGNNKLRAVIASFSNPTHETGDAPSLAALAQQRAASVRDLLLSLGVAADKLWTQEPVAHASGDAAHAIEVRLTEATAADTTDAEAGASATTALTSESDDARVVVEDGTVKFYFAVGKADIPAGSSEALLDVATAAISGKKAVISGFTDASGSAELNQELAKQRAFAVRDALVALNVPESSLELREPETLTGTGDAAEARRVEVRLAD